MARVTQSLHRHFHSEQNEGSNETFLSGVCTFFLFLMFLEDSEWLKYASVKWLSIMETLTHSRFGPLGICSTPAYWSVTIFTHNKGEKPWAHVYIDYFIINSLILQWLMFFLNLSQRGMLPLQVDFSKGTYLISIITSAVLPTFPTLIASWIIDCWLI